MQSARGVCALSAQRTRHCLSIDPKAAELGELPVDRVIFAL
jgi:hypothetical protein